MTKLNILDIRIFDIHLTTLLTYLGTSILVFYRRRSILLTTALLLVSTISFETIWIPLYSLVHGTKFFGVSSLLINLTIILFSLRIAQLHYPPHLRGSLLFGFFLSMTVLLWIFWLPSFYADSENRIFADQIKIFQSLTITYPFMKK